MRHIKEVIDREVKRKNLTKKQFAESIGMTETGFYRLLKRNDLKLSTLEEMGKVLNIPVEDFFIDEQQKESKLEKSAVNQGYNLNEWYSKEKQYKETIEQLLGTIRNLSLGKLRGISLA